MAIDQAMDARLWRWAEWRKSGDGSGYPMTNVLDKSWSPPTPGLTPTLRTAGGSDGPQTQRMVAQMSDRVQATLVAHYIKRMTNTQAALLLDCQPDTVADRIECAHRHMLRLLGPSPIRAAG